MFNKARISQLLSKDIVKVSSWTGLSAIIRIATQFLTAKVLAVTVGPVGVAQLGQLSNAMGIAMAAATAAITVGVTKYIAEHQQQPEQQEAYIRSASGIIGVCSIAISIIIISVTPWLGPALFKTDVYNKALYVMGGTIALYAFHTLWVAILNGYNQFKKIVIINIVTSIGGLLLTLLLVYQFSTIGAMMAFVLGQSVICLVTYFFVKEQSWWAAGRPGLQVSKKMAVQLGRFSIMAIVAALVTPIVQIVIRSMVQERVSPVAAGIWDGMNRLSGTYLLLITSTLAVYYLPKLAVLKETSEVKAEINSTYKLVMPLLLAGSIVVYLCRSVVVKLLFSAEFLPMTDLFAFQLTGDCLKIASWIIGYMMWARGYVKIFVITEIIAGVLLVLATHFCLQQYGLQGTAIAYCINYAAYFCYIYIIIQKKMQYRA